MDKVLNALKCVNCRVILSEPVFLPCGHMICLKHTQVEDSQVMCSDCGIHHPNIEFVVIKGVADMVEANLPSLDFGNQHKQVTKLCDELKIQLDKNDIMFNDYESHIHEEISSLKNRVMLKSEQLKLSIDETTQEIINDLEELERQCKINYGEANADGFQFSMDKLKKINESAKTKWNEWSQMLNDFKYDEEKYKKIQEDCNQTFQDLMENVRNLEKELFMNRLHLQKNSVLYFEKIEIESILKNMVKYFILYVKKNRKLYNDSFP